MSQVACPKLGDLVGKDQWWRCFLFLAELDERVGWRRILSTVTRRPDRAELKRVSSGPTRVDAEVMLLSQHRFMPVRHFPQGSLQQKEIIYTEPNNG